MADPSRLTSFRLAATPTYYIYTIQAQNYANLAQVLRPFGLNPVAWRVLANLQEQDGYSIGDLAERVVTERSRLSRIVATMARRGWVLRQPRRGDRRNIEVFLTAAGRRKFIEALPTVQRLMAEALSGFGREEVATLIQLLRRMRDNVHRTALDLAA